MPICRTIPDGTGSCGKRFQGNAHRIRARLLEAFMKKVSSYASGSRQKPRRDVFSAFQDRDNAEALFCAILTVTSFSDAFS